MFVKNEIPRKNKITENLNKLKNQPSLSDEKVTTPGWPV
jgi:hypothetical protein